MARWMTGVVYESGTPFGVEFPKGRRVYFRSEGKNYVAMDSKSLRYVTQVQLGDHLDNIRMAPGDYDGEAELAALREAILNTLQGTLIPFTRVNGQPLPEGVPSTYRDMKIHITRTTPWITCNLYQAGWYVDDQLGYHMTLEPKWIRRLMKILESPDPPEILKREPEETYAHEFYEAHRALQMAQQAYPNATDEQMEGLSIQFAGPAHAETIASVDKIPDEKRYDRWDAQELRSLGFQPPQNRG